MRKLALHLLILNIFCLNSVYSAPLQSLDELPANYKKVFSFPINILEGNTIILTAEVPAGFKPGEDLGKMIDAGLIEYIPEKENVNTWTEIITFVPIAGKQLSADTVVDNTATWIKEKTSDLAFVKRDKIHTKKYDTSEAFIAYTANDQRELLWIYGASGPADTAVVQYTIRIPKQLKKENLTPYIEKITAFKNKYIKITNGIRTEKDVVVPAEQDEHKQ